MQVVEWPSLIVVTAESGYTVYLKRTKSKQEPVNNHYHNLLRCLCNVLFLPFCLPVVSVDCEPLLMQHAHTLRLLNLRPSVVVHEEFCTKV